jgi:hypothetical protein
MLPNRVRGVEGKGKKHVVEIKSFQSYSTGIPHSMHTKFAFIHRNPYSYPQFKVFFRAIPEDLHTPCAKKKRAIFAAPIDYFIPHI